MGLSLNGAAYIIVMETLWIFNFYIGNLCSHKSPQAKDDGRTLCSFGGLPRASTVENRILDLLNLRFFFYMALTVPPFPFALFPEEDWIKKKNEKIKRCVCSGVRLRQGRSWFKFLLSCKVKLAIFGAAMLFPGFQVILRIKLVLARERGALCIYPELLEENRGSSTTNK